MRHHRAVALSFPLAVLFAYFASERPSWGAASLGKIDFKVTGPEVARRQFLRGMLALHSFWYEEAADAFRAATAAAPSFAMGYWGEALTFYHPVWCQEDLAASRAVMAKLPATAAVSPTERAFIDSARLLFGEGDRTSRWSKYADALGKLHARSPEDDEAATLYAVAILGVAFGERTLDGKNPRFGRFAEAAAIGLEVLRRNPEHPGAAHYVIHAFDDPEHAILALPAARRYALIAPEAYHARHMPSHIFVQLGMWSEALASNESAWAASKAWVQRKRLDTSYYDFHSLSWLLSIRLELGQRSRAAEVLDRARDALERSKDPGGLPLIYSQMAAEYLITTGEWQLMDGLLEPLTRLTSAAAVPPHGVQDPKERGPTCHPRRELDSLTAVEGQALLVYLHGEAAAAKRDAAGIGKSLLEMAKVEPKLNKADAELAKVRQFELRSALADLQGRLSDAVADLRQAIALDERTPPAGPAGVASPRELLGELLLRHGSAIASLSEFRETLASHPKRSLSLLGAARAAKVAGDPAARDLWTELGAVWEHADADTPGLAEVHRATEQ